MPNNQHALSGAQTASVAYAGIGFIFGVGAGIVTFILAWAYCVVTYGFVLGLGLGCGFRLRSVLALSAGRLCLFGGAALLIVLVIDGVALISATPGLNTIIPHVVHAICGAAIGWLIWRLAPRSISFRRTREERDR